MIVSFLEGKAKKNLSPNNCKSIGIEVAKMHDLTKNFKLKEKMIYQLNLGEIYSMLLKINVQRYMVIYKIDRGKFK